MSQSIQAMTSSSLGQPPSDKPQLSPSNLSAPVRAKLRHTPSWSAASTFTQKRPERRTIGQVLDESAAQKPTSGGSSETEKKDPTVSPTGSSPSIADITATPVRNCPSTRRKT